MSSSTTINAPDRIPDKTTTSTGGDAPSFTPQSTSQHPDPAVSDATDDQLSTPQNTSTTTHPNPQRPDPTHATESGLAAPATTTPSELSRLTLRLHRALRQFPDFPTPGILFEDICPIFADAKLHADLVRALEIFVDWKLGVKAASERGITSQPVVGGEDITPQKAAKARKDEHQVDVVVGLEARGFLFGPSLALALGAGFVPVRKKGKLPGETQRAEYKKEYGTDVFEMQAGAIKEGQRVLIVDDIIATGGSAACAGELVQRLGGSIVAYVFILELDFLKGREKLNAPVHTLLSSQSKEEGATEDAKGRFGARKDLHQSEKGPMA